MNSNWFRYGSIGACWLAAAWLLDPPLRYIALIAAVLHCAAPISPGIRRRIASAKRLELSGGLYLILAISALVLAVATVTLRVSGFGSDALIDFTAWLAITLVLLAFLAGRREGTSD